MVAVVDRGLVVADGTPAELKGPGTPGPAGATGYAGRGQMP